MGMIRAAGLGYEYLRYEEEGQEPEVTKAIEDVSLEIQKGQFIAVLGHNGSGKSTLAKHINALLVPTEGTMWVDDMDTAKEPELWKIRQKAGMVFQNPDDQLFMATVGEDVAERAAAQVDEFHPGTQGLERGAQGDGPGLVILEGAGDEHRVPGVGLEGESRAHQGPGLGGGFEHAAHPTAER